MEKIEPIFIYLDPFNGPTINSDFWELPKSGDSSFLGRAQLRVGGFPDFDGGLPLIKDGKALFRLDKFNPLLLSNPGEDPSFYGQEIISKETFSRGSGLGVQAKIRLAAGAPKGLVASLFTFVFANGIRDEIDIEILTNKLNSDPSQLQELLTNVYDDEPIDGVAGDFQFEALKDFDFTEFHTYRMEWLPDRVRWLVDGNVIREEFETVPDDPTTLRLNFWAPDDKFEAAYNGDLQPVTRLEDNETYFLEVDSFQVDKLANIIFDADQQNQISRLAYDLTAFDGNTVTFNLGEDVARLGEAVFDNLTGLYEVADKQGGIDTNGDGRADLSPNEQGYAKAAIEGRLKNVLVRAGSSGNASRNTTPEEFGDILLEGGKYYAPFVIANAGDLGFDGFITAEEGEDSVFNNAATTMEEAVAYFSYLGANPDGANHLRAFGNNTFGFEDLPSNLGMSDNDFNDAIISFKVS